MLRYAFIHFLIYFLHIYDPFAIFVQVIQQVFVAKEWVRNARNEVRAKAHSCVEVEKAFRAFKEKHTELANKLIVVERERLSAEEGLKNAEAQAEDQRKQLYTTEIELAT